MRFQPRPIPFKPMRLNGLSERLLASHYENNYGGAVRRLNAIADELAANDPAALPGFRLNGLKREELIASNSMMLHEVYFDSLGEGGGGEPDGTLAEAIAKDFGSLDRWRREFVAMGKALGGGSGWVVLTRSARDGRLANVWSADHTHSLAGGTPLLALDMYEHSFHIDFGSNAAAYVDAFMANVAWPRVAARFAGETAAPSPHTVDVPTAKAMLDSDPDLLVIDARRVEDAKITPVRLRGARRAPPDKVAEVAASLPRSAKVLVYCAWGFEVGGNCAARLREHGVDALGIAGGIGTWRANGFPTEPLNEGDKS
ncbi:MAG: Fe-Mn family superoxide dismutase [Reyranellales bacterium]